MRTCATTKQMTCELMNIGRYGGLCPGGIKKKYTNVTMAVVMSGV